MICPQQTRLGKHENALKILDILSNIHKQRASRSSEVLEAYHHLENRP